MMKSVTPESFVCRECGHDECLTLYTGKHVCSDCGMVHNANTRSSDLLENPLLESENKNNKTNNQGSNGIFEIWEKSISILDANEKNIVTALSEITRLGDSFSVTPTVLKNASSTYRKLIEKRHLKRYNLKSIAAAVFYIACRETYQKISLSAIEKNTNITKKELAKCYRLIVNELGMKVKRKNPLKYECPDEFTDAQKKITHNILDSANEQRITVGKNPDSVIAAACYITGILTCKVITQRKLSEYYRVTQTTIRNRYQDLMKSLSISLYL